MDSSFRLVIITLNRRLQIRDNKSKRKINMIFGPGRLYHIMCFLRTFSVLSWLCKGHGVLRRVNTPHMGKEYVEIHVNKDDNIHK